MVLWLIEGLRPHRPPRKPKSLGIRSLTTTILIVYGVLALIAVIFNLPHKNLFAHGLQSFLGFLLVEKLWVALSQGGQLNAQLGYQDVQVLAGLRLIVF